MFQEMFPWMGDVARYALYAVIGAAGLTVLWFAGRFARFWRTGK